MAPNDSAAPRAGTRILDSTMAVLVPAALLAALGSGLTVWRELPTVTQALERMEKVVERFEVRVAALETIRYQVGADLRDCQQRIRRIERSNGGEG